MELIKKKKLKNSKPTQKPNTTKNTNNTNSSSYIKEKKGEPPVYKEYIGVESPSLKKITLNETNKNIPTQTETIITDKTNNFNQDDLNNVWEEFVESIKETRKRFYQLFKNQRPKLLDDFAIQINVNNNSQKQDIKEKINKEISYFLQKKLENNKISINLKVQEANNEGIIYGDTNIYQYLLKKNPNLELLKDTFGLDFD